jgi:SNF family Na+-dependent transporter
MKNQKIWLWSAVNAVGVFIYVVAVVLVMTNGEKIFGEMENFWGPVTFLLLFVFSALVCGLLIFGRPIYLWFDNAKKEAVKMILFTVVNLFVILLVAFLVNVLAR